MTDPNISSRSSGMGRRSVRRGWLAPTIVALTAVSVGCSSLVYRGAIIDARDSITERRFGQALADLERARRSGNLDDAKAAEVASLEALCEEKLRR
jgi:hypothetical protein